MFSSITADFHISSALRWAEQDQWSSVFLFFFLLLFCFVFFGGGVAGTAGRAFCKCRRAPDECLSFLSFQPHPLFQLSTLIQWVVTYRPAIYGILINRVQLSTDTPIPGQQPQPGPSWTMWITWFPVRMTLCQIWEILRETFVIWRLLLAWELSILVTLKFCFKWYNAGYLFPCSPEINRFVPLFPKIKILISYVLCSLFPKNAFVPLFPSFLVLCSLVPLTLMSSFPKTPGRASIPSYPYAHNFSFACWSVVLINLNKKRNSLCLLFVFENVTFFKKEPSFLCPASHKWIPDKPVETFNGAFISVWGLMVIHHAHLWWSALTLTYFNSTHWEWQFKPLTMFSTTCLCLI